MATREDIVKQYLELYTITDASAINEIMDKVETGHVGGVLLFREIEYPTEYDTAKINFDNASFSEMENKIHRGTLSTVKSNISAEMDWKTIGEMRRLFGTIDGLTNPETYIAFNLFISIHNEQKIVMKDEGDIPSEEMKHASVTRMTYALKTLSVLIPNLALITFLSTVGTKPETGQVYDSIARPTIWVRTDHGYKNIMHISPAAM